MDIVVSSLGILYVGSITSVRHKDPMTILRSGYAVTAVRIYTLSPQRSTVIFDLSDDLLPPFYTTIQPQAAAAVGFLIICRTLLSPASAPQAWLHFAGCGACGMATSYVFIASTQYYTDYAYHPVRSIAEVKVIGFEMDRRLASDAQVRRSILFRPSLLSDAPQASTTGHGTNIITGISVGMKSVVVPVCAVSAAVISAYHLGRTSGLGEGHNAGLFGTAVATMGMLSTACYVLAINGFGPIADNGACVFRERCGISLLHSISMAG